MKEESTVRPSTSILDLVRTPGMRRISCRLMFIWFSTCLGFFIIATDVQGFSVSIFLVQVTFGVIDIIGKQASFTALDCLGRRPTLAFNLIFAGLLIITNIFVPPEMPTLRTVLVTIAKGCLAGAFNCSIMFSSELYPTVLRQTGLGFLSMNARIGAIVSPVVRMTSNYVSFLPAVIIGTATIVAGGIACTLMETHKRPLLDTVEELEHSRSRRKPLPGEKEEVLLA